MNELSIVVSGLNIIAIVFVGYFQYKMQKKLLELEKSVVLNAEPTNNGVISLRNCGKVNLYIKSFHLLDKNSNFEKERLIAINSWYWIPTPNINNMILGKEYVLTLYLYDEYRNKYIFTGGVERQSNQKIIIWSHKIQKKNWIIE